MTTDDFRPSPELAQAFRRPGDYGRPFHELVLPRRPIVEDLSLVPAEAEFVATRGTAAHLERLVELDVVALWANPATAELLEYCAKAPRLRALYVCHFKKLAEVPLNGAKIEHLLLSWAPKLTDLSCLADLPALRTLYLEDMNRIDLTTLPHLPQLVGIHIGGGMWNTLSVPSLAPLRRAPALRHLTLSNVRPVDGSLRPLAGLSSLRELTLPNFFEVEEFARLAAALPDARSNALTPFFATFDGTPAESSPYRCPRCGGPRRMLTGRPAVILCPDCDAVKMQRRVVRWETARSSPWPVTSARGG